MINKMTFEQLKLHDYTFYMLKIVNKTKIIGVCLQEKIIISTSKGHVS